MATSSGASTSSVRPTVSDAGRLLLASGICAAAGACIAGDPNVVVAADPPAPAAASVAVAADPNVAVAAGLDTAAADLDGVVARDARSYRAVPDVEVVLTPAGVRPDGRIPELGVTLVLSGVDARAGEPLLCLPFVTVNVDTVARSITDLRARDARGELALAVEDREPPDGNAKRCWAVARATSGELTVSYDVPVKNATGTRGAAPPVELRSAEGGVSGGGQVFLLMPDDETPRRYTVRWNLAALPDGAIGLSSYGLGDVAPAVRLPPERFTDSYFMAGDIGRYPEGDTGHSPGGDTGRDREGAIGDGFFAAWQGTPPFDARLLMRRGDALYEEYLVFFRPPGTPPFGVFLRRNPVNPGGGMGLRHSFIITYGPGTKVDELHFTLAHEMFHTFAGSLDAPPGLLSSWFGEGLAVHYTRKLLLRTGQISPEAFLESLNSTAGRYYTNAMIDTPNAGIPARFWADTRVRVLPYDRGSLYFAELDHRLRRESEGKRSLDDLLRAMLERRRAGAPMDRAAWVRLLEETLGPSAVSRFEAMLEGTVMLPEPAAFGPCFTRVRKPLQRYQLGFEPKVLTENPRIVRGLIPGSAAARAGLENGDEIMKPVAQDAIQADQRATLRLAVRRDRRTFSVTYRPRGETVEAWQWERREDVPDGTCAF